MFSGFGSLFGEKKDAPVAAPQQAATNAVPEKSLMQRWFGGSDAAQPSEPSQFPSNVPLPPRRASTNSSERVSDASHAVKAPLIKGAQPIVTADLAASR